MQPGGAPVTAGAGTLFFTPGRKKVAGETLPLVIDAATTAPGTARSAASIASHRNFQFNLTCPSIKQPDTMATFNSKAESARKMARSSVGVLVGRRRTGRGGRSGHQQLSPRAPRRNSTAPRINSSRTPTTPPPRGSLPARVLTSPILSTNDTERAALASQGIAACRQADRARSRVRRRRIIIWAMNLGQLARTESLGALTLVKEMEREFKTAVGTGRAL